MASDSEGTASVFNKLFARGSEKKGALGKLGYGFLYEKWGIQEATTIPGYEFEGSSWTSIPHLAGSRVESLECTTTA